jgi:hypothetical protein
MRIKTAIVLGALVGILLTLTAIKVADMSREIFSRLDRIENYLESHPIPRFEVPDGVPQSHRERSHKNELGQPQQWKV